jgi:hypothetical protein
MILRCFNDKKQLLVYPLSGFYLWIRIVTFNVIYVATAYPFNRFIETL